jgi:hypothetical protein
LQISKPGQLYNRTFAKNAKNYMVGRMKDHRIAILSGPFVIPDFIILPFQSSVRKKEKEKAI